MHGTGRQGQARAALAVGGVFPQELLQWEFGLKGTKVPQRPQVPLLFQANHELGTATRLLAP